MIKNNIIQNLGLDAIPEYGIGGILRALKDDPSLIFNPGKLMVVGEAYDRKKAATTKRDDTVDTRSSKSKTASTGKKSSATPTEAVTTSTPQSSTPSSAATGNMDWMSEYGSSTTGTTQQQEVEPFNAVNKVWNDDVLSKVDTAVASRYLKNNLQDLLNMYNMKVAETIGQKRS